MTGWAPLTDDQFYIDLVSVVATVMVGYGVALGRARATVAEQRTAELARQQETRTQAAVAQEQARIAREVHDIVAHDVSVMVAQAGAARRVFAAQPQIAVDALASIEAVGRDALDGLRRLVSLLRTDLEQSGRSPQPTLDRLPWLLEQVERAGLAVTLDIHGERRPLPATVELNAYRIVQEALTNILKHAGPTDATVLLDYGQDELRVEVSDRGAGQCTEPLARLRPDQHAAARPDARGPSDRGPCGPGLHGLGAASGRGRRSGPSRTTTGRVRRTDMQLVEEVSVTITVLIADDQPSCELPCAPASRPNRT